MVKVGLERQWMKNCRKTGWTEGWMDGGMDGWMIIVTEAPEELKF